MKKDNLAELSAIIYGPNDVTNSERKMETYFV